MQELEQHPATICGVSGTLRVLLHRTDRGVIYEACFSAEIATEPVHIGEAFARKPSLHDIEQAKKNFESYIDRQKALREGWN